VNASNVSRREIARGLLDALRPALDPGATPRERAVARDVAQVLGLDGLDAVLAELDRLNAGGHPPDVGHVASRLSRLAAQAEQEESPAAFRAADAELAALARALRETEWSDAGGTVVAVYSAAEVLADLPIEPSADLARARLSAPAAASLRAALEWIGADEALLVQAAVHDSALSLTCPVAHAGGLGPAGAVLASIEGSLGEDPDGRWTLRVPLYVERPSFLLLRIGNFPIALPWHAVARLRMLPAAEWTRVEEPVLEPLTTLQPGEDERPGALVAQGLVRAWFVADRIVWRIATVPEEAHDRGPFGASDRLVPMDNGEHYWVLEPSWLLRAVSPPVVAPPAPRPRFGHAALPAEAPATPAGPAPDEPPASEPAATAAEPAAPAPEPTAHPLFIRTKGTGSEHEALADAVARALAILHAERARDEQHSTRQPEPAATAVSEPAAPASREMPRPASREMPRPATREMPRPASREMPRPATDRPGAIVNAQITVLRPEHAEPLQSPIEAIWPAPPVPRPVEPGAPVAPAPPVPSGTPAPASSPEASTGAMSGRRALVADDSMVARIFLARLLERRGFVVELVGDGQSLWNELRHGPWAVVCADVTMPDSHGRAHLERLLDFRAACREPFTLIALTRDAAEEHEALLAGARLHLRKPFDPGALDALLER
jgi:CheY-like chemotaxis protein